MWRVASKGLCCVLSLALILDSNVMRVSESLAQKPKRPTGAATQRVPSPEELEKIADRMEKIFEALEADAKDIPSDTFDPRAIIKVVGRDPVKLFEWVRDNTYLVPYRGVLRDYKGVLMDRLGNSLDRSLLLLVLLYESGNKTLQLAQTELSEGQAAHLLEKVKPVPKGGTQVARIPSRREVTERLGKYARQNNVDPEKIRRISDQAILQSQRLAEDAVQRTADQSTAIIELLRDNKLNIPDRQEQVASLRNDAIKALRHHWWVQWHNGQRWVDLDPSLPDASLGRPFANVKPKIVPGNALTEHLWPEAHRLQIRVIIDAGRTVG